MTNIGVLASGSGTNLQALIDAAEKGYFDGKISVVICDKKDAYALERAKKHGIPSFFVNFKDFANKKKCFERICEILDEYSTELVLLAGFMRIVDSATVKKYSGKMINIHPALLPSFKGLDGIKQAYEYGVKVSGVTVHFVDIGVDTGPIILQDIVWLNEGETLEEIEKKVHKVEHKLFPKAVKLFTEGKLFIEGRIVHIKE